MNRQLITVITNHESKRIQRTYHLKN